MEISFFLKIPTDGASLISGSTISYKIVEQTPSFSVFCPCFPPHPRVNVAVPQKVAESRVSRLFCFSSSLFCCFLYLIRYSPLPHAAFRFSLKDPRALSFLAEDDSSQSRNVPSMSSISTGLSISFAIIM